MPAEDEMLRRPLVFSLPEMDRVQAKTDIVYKTIGSVRLAVDLYLPPDVPDGALTPAVIFIGGDAPEEMTLGPLKQSGQYTGWGRLVAASGLIGIVTNHRSMHQPPQPYVNLPAVAADIADMLTFMQERGASYGIDADHLALSSFSGGSPFALYAALKQRPSFIRCLVAYYGLLDLRHLLTGDQPPEAVALVNEYSPAAQIQRQPETVPPFLVARAGLDQAWINQGLDSFVTEALKHNLSLNLLNHPTGQHAFDILDDNQRSREIIQDTLAFLQRHLKEERA